jgi:hypothetical protein
MISLESDTYIPENEKIEILHLFHATCEFKGKRKKGKREGYKRKRER